jgi:hypothetical protein
MTQTSTLPVLEKIANIRQQINEIAEAPEVLDLVKSDEYFPDLRIGDAIQALDELSYALSQYLDPNRQLQRQVQSDIWCVQQAIYTAVVEGTPHATQTVTALGLPVILSALKLLALEEWRYVRNEEISKAGYGDYYDVHIPIPPQMASAAKVAATWFSFSS